MKLTYFNVRGLAETSRILLAIGKEEYEDFRYPLNVIDMSKFKMEKEEFDKDKVDGKLVKSLNKVPFLEVDGTIIPQSKSIERFLAKRFNMMGETDLEAVQIDSLCECVRDFKDLYQKVRNAKDKDKDKATNEWFTVTLVEKLKLLEEILGDNDGFSVSDKLSLSDVVLFTFITQFFDNREASLNATLVAPKLRKIIEKVKEIPEIIEWFEKRPVTDF